MNELDQLEFDKLDLEGLKTLIQWAIAEGWNSGPYDADAFWLADPDAFYGYFHHGKMIAGGAIVSYDGKFGFMGLFIVKPEYRSKGIGRKLWFQRRDLLKSRLDKGASIGMDGVVAMQPFYKKGGFEFAFMDERYENIGSPFKIDGRISDIGIADFQRIHDYDKNCFGFARTRFLESWIYLPESHAFKYVKNEVIKGFAMIRKVKVGYKICPLFADTPEIAEALYKACLNAAIGAPVYIDIPMLNKKAVEMVKKYEAKYVFECARMYLGSAPKIPIDKIFGITTFELG